MEITTVVGIIIAVIIMLFGLRILFKKPANAAPSLDSELHVDTDSQQPVIPRHVRDQLQSANEPSSIERVEPKLAESAVELAQDAKKAETKSENAEVKAPVVAAAETTNQVESKTDAVKEQTIQAEQTVTKDSAEHSVNANIEKAEISEFEDESSILDEHLHEQQRVDEESALSTAVEFIALNVYPERRVLSGEKTLKVLLKYGLRFGEMACFHRYNQDDSKLLFSVLQITDEGAAGFDLETLSTEQVKGLAFFLALPHSDVQNAFDTMDSLSRLIAREIDGTVYDQNNQEFTPQLREQWRHHAIDYRAGQTVEV
ncbi:MULTISPECIES: cell division protein ZipA C-terminal FtsZ-binding domain-containing protein [Acinetobacter Taxon 24D]|jgi:cell division protein ZipA|uniref:cell division protein ZipA C-terminal FtsZ-binding domain-containing protein n=1 Tax=Acinetobacter Taxon 24D TaxID=2839057 RepID=UPI00103CD9B6|nr:MULTISPECIES: cell division protein ZipA C-terminal FtsZ-binding domain-containing protein [Acinetobacter Taxon 24D]NNG83120.1 cell division protein ZipA [Acinetobacter sp. ANC 5378]NNG99970.1 cell division protein ZipA [Acinetobacter sp. ANC 5414]TCH63952.1 cell division protein ZipA [Acinetobacter sp. ANC 4862]